MILQYEPLTENFCIIRQGPCKGKCGTSNNPKLSELLYPYLTRLVNHILAGTDGFIYYWDEGKVSLPKKFIYGEAFQNSSAHPTISCTKW